VKPPTGLNPVLANKPIWPPSEVCAWIGSAPPSLAKRSRSRRAPCGVRPLASRREWEQRSEMVHLVFRGERRLSARLLPRQHAVRMLREQRSACPKSRSRAPKRGPHHAPLRQVPPARGRFRSMSRLPGRSPLPSVIHGLRGCDLHERALRVLAGLRGPSTGPRTFTYVLVCATLLTLAPSSDAFRSLRPSREAGFPLLGLSKDRPSVVRKPRSPSPG
jgi:hypothetical protein